MPRNASGTYSLPAGNPVISGTVISSTWANDTMSDLANEMTDSLSRSGDGGMLAPLMLTDGTVGAPAMSWTNDTTSGWYRAAANDFRFSVLNTDWFVLNGTEVQVRNTTTAAGLERVLTISDIDGLTPDSYSYSSAVVTAPATSGLNALAIGDAAQAQADDTISIGQAAQTFGASAIAIGAAAYAPAPDSLAFGASSEAVSAGAVSIGATASSTGLDAITIGDAADSNADNVITIGRSSVSNAPDCITMGNAASSNGPDSVTLGTGATTASQGAIGIGEAANVLGTDSVAVGPHTNAGGNNSVALGPHANVGFAGALVINAGPAVISAPGADSITLATSLTNSFEFYQGKFSLNNASAQYIVPEHADATLLTAETGSFVYETATGMRYYDGTSWQTLLTLAGSSGVVTLTGAQTITGEKTFTDTQRFQLGDTTAPTIRLGADTGTNTITNATEKRATVTAPAYNSLTDPDIGLMSYLGDPSGANNGTLRLGGAGPSFSDVAAVSFYVNGAQRAALDQTYLSLDVSLILGTYTVATAPAAGVIGQLIYVSDGDAGSPCLAVADGASFKRIPLGATISST